MGAHQGGKSPTITQLWPHHRSMARAMVTGGLRPGELARIYGYSEGQISRIIQSPLFQAEVNKIECRSDEEALEMRKELEARHPLCLENVDKALMGKGDKLAVNVAFEIFDRTGFGKVGEAQKHEHLHLHKEIKDLGDDELLDAAMEMIEAEVV